MRHWTCGWSISHARILVTICNSHKRTSRIVIPNNLDGDLLRLRFSNLYGHRPVSIGNARIALCNAQGEIDERTDRALIVGGKTKFSIPKTGELYSDEIPFSIRAGDHLAVSLYFPSRLRPLSGNEIRKQTLRSISGDYCSAQVFPPEEDVLVPKALVEKLPDVQIPVTPILSGLDIYTDKTPRVIAAFGDSITQQSTWTRPLTQRLYARFPREVTLSNHGIGGNRLLRDTAPVYDALFGDAGIHRFEHDILSIQGLTHVIFFLGINDIGLPGDFGIPRDQLPTPEDYYETVTALVDTLHGRGVQVFGATLLPRTFTKIYDDEREKLRCEINAWIRTSKVFDRVLDFDAVTRRSDGEHGLMPEYDCGDGLHPSPVGGAAIAESIDLSWFF